MSKQPQELGFLLRCRYVKQNRLRYLAHLEILRTIERTIRRADLPYAVSCGFSPHMRIGFSPALSVGTASCDEYFDLLLRSFIPTHEVLRRLREASVPDLMVQEVRYVDRQTTSLSAALDVSLYRVEIDMSQLSAVKLEQAWSAMIAQNQLSFVKKGKIKTITLQDKLYMSPLIVASSSSHIVVLFATKALNSGSLRPDIFVYQAIADALNVSRNDDGSYPFDVTQISFERCGQWALSEDNLLVSAFDRGVPPEKTPREKVYRKRSCS